MKVYIGADHRGYNTKEAIKKWLAELHIETHDEGALAYDQEDDYPDGTIAVAQKVREDKDSRGIVFCGSGVGVDITANKINGIRCGFAHTPKQIESARSHDDINMLAVPADYMDEETIKETVKTFLNTEFISEERHKRRIEKIHKLESRIMN